MIRRILAFVAMVALASSTSACEAVMSLDRFQAAEEPVTSDGGADADPSGDKNLVLNFERMAPHPTQLFEFRIVDASNRVQTRGLLDPLGEQDVTVHVPIGVPQAGGPYRLDFYADMNGSRSYDGIGSGTANDHAWRIPLQPSTVHGRTVQIQGSDMVLTFVHDTVFTDIDTTLDGTPMVPGDTGLPATIHVLNLPPSYLGVRLQVRVASTDTGRTVGLYRFPQAKTPPLDAVIPGVVEGGASYAVSIYVDVNGNGEYENPATGGVDRGWCLQRMADPATGLVYDFDPALAGDGTCDVGPP